jgi:signal transduction histidine kinase
MSLPAAKDLRARADRVVERAALRGTPRKRFLDEQRARLAVRLLASLAFLAVGTGASAVFDLLHDPPVSRVVMAARGLTAAVLAALAIVSNVARKSHATLLALAMGAGVSLAAGWAVVVHETGGAASPALLAVPLGLSVLVMAVPLVPWQAPVLAGVGVAAVALAAPGGLPTAGVVLVLLGGGGWIMGRTRRRRELRVFLQVERFAAATRRLRGVQDQLVVVEKLEALRVLVGGMAHELNNALAVSMASTEQIARVIGADPAAATKAAERAHGGLARIRATIERLKRFALSEDGVLESADLCALLDFALESAVGRAQSGVAIERHYAGDLPAIDTHVAGLAEALFQVARNAVQSMPKGGTLRASVRREGDSVVLAVADEGGGIPPSRLGKVFDPFYARESADSTWSGGRALPPTPGRSGLGLSAVYGLVSAIGGTVDIQSEVGRGTEVSIRLPRVSRR